MFVAYPPAIRIVAVFTHIQSVDASRVAWNQSLCEGTVFSVAFAVNEELPSRVRAYFHAEDRRSGIIFALLPGNVLCHRFDRRQKGTEFFIAQRT